jgi:hypothetical protein
VVVELGEFLSSRAQEHSARFNRLAIVWEMVRGSDRSAPIVNEIDAFCGDGNKRGSDVYGAAKMTNLMNLFCVGVDRIRAMSSKNGSGEFVI